MKTYTTQQIKPFDFKIEHASSLTSGYGHKLISVCVITENGSKKEFKATTNNMPDFDIANDLEGQEKYEALFDLVENKLDGEISEWIYSLEN